MSHHYICGYESTCGVDNKTRGSEVGAMNILRELRSRNNHVPGLCDITNIFLFNVFHLYSLLTVSHWKTHWLYKDCISTHRFPLEDRLIEEGLYLYSLFPTGRQTDCKTTESLLTVFHWKTD